MVVGSCWGTPVVSSTSTPLRRSNLRSARYPVSASTKSVDSVSSRSPTSDRITTSERRISMTRLHQRTAMLPSLTRLVTSGRIHGFTPRSNSPKKWRSEEHTSELQSRRDLVCRLLLEKKKKIQKKHKQS